MGAIIFKLAEKSVNDQCGILASRLITEENKLEDFHVHLRNLRLQFSEEEFTVFCEHIIKSFNAYKSGSGALRDDGRGGSNNKYFVLDEKRINPSPEIIPDKIQLELNHPDVIHVHVRNMRLEMTPSEFIDMTVIFNQAAFNLTWKKILRKLSIFCRIVHLV